MSEPAQIRVAVSGVLGRMGSTVLAAVASDPDMVPVGGADPESKADTVAHPVTGDPLPLSADLAGLIEATDPDVVVDFSNAEGARKTFAVCAPAGVSVVSGSTGLWAEDLEEAAALATQHSVGIISASNFALGAVLLGYLAGIASQYFEYADVIESHHEAKIDAPSGTALSIAQAMAEGRGRRFNQNVAEKQTLTGTRGGDFEGINVHSARMPGRVARHEVVFGGTGQTLTMVHDSITRESFMPGVLLAIKRVVTLDGLMVGLDRVLGLDKPKP